MKKPTYKELWERLEIVLAENEKLTAKVADLERKLADRERQDNRQAARFRKDEDQRKSPSEHKKPGRKPGHPGSRKLPPSPDQVQREERVALECCPDCKAELTERAEHVHYVLDLPVLPVEWSKYITESGFCVNCNCRRWSSHEEMPSLAVREIKTTLEQATEVSRSFRNRSGHNCRDIHSAVTGSTVRVREGEVFDTLIPKRTGR